MSGVSVGDVFEDNPVTVARRRLRVTETDVGYVKKYAVVVNERTHRRSYIRVDRLLSSRYRRVERNETDA